MARLKMDEHFLKKESARFHEVDALLAAALKAAREQDKEGSSPSAMTAMWAGEIFAKWNTQFHRSDVLRALAELYHTHAVARGLFEADLATFMKGYQATWSPNQGGMGWFGRGGRVDD